MNKNYIFVLVAIIIVIVLVIAFSSMSATLTLDQIIKNRDCSALNKWENEHMFDDNLNISSEQLSAAMSLATECVGKALGNMFGNSDVSTDTTDPMVVLDELLKKKDCDGVNAWGRDHIFINKDITLDVWGIEDIFISKDITLNIKQQSDIDKLALECNTNELEKFLRESNLSTDTTDPMVVLGKILNKKDCDGLEIWLKDHNEYYEDSERVIKLGVGNLKYGECWK